MTRPRRGDASGALILIRAWCRSSGAERGDGALTRHGLEEYVSDCVILLDHRVKEQVATRRLRVVKYRGSGHGTNEYPFLIDEHGISVLPITSVGLTHAASNERVSSAQKYGQLMASRTSEPQSTTGRRPNRSQAQP